MIIIIIIVKQRKNKNIFSSFSLYYNIKLKFKNKKFYT